MQALLNRQLFHMGDWEGSRITMIPVKNAFSARDWEKSRSMASEEFDGNLKSIRY